MNYEEISKSLINNLIEKTNKEIEIMFDLEELQGELSLEDQAQLDINIKNVTFWKKNLKLYN